MARMTSTRRVRTRIACYPCRQRKRKCDGNLPCAMCSTYGYRCQYETNNNDFAAPFARRSAIRAAYEVEQCEENLKTSSTYATTTTKKGILDPTKSRYMGLSSAVAFPRVLALELNSTDPPHLHSFAWHCGIRDEEKSETHLELSAIITKEECIRFSDRYFKVVHPIFGFLDQGQTERSFDLYWNSKTVSASGAVIAGIVALGSFFSGNCGHPRESDIVQYAKGILEDPKFSRLPSVEQVSAWVLRTIYLRATTRPQVAWLASCTTIHLAEATALHHEANEVELTTANNNVDPLTSERARRLFWCAWSINTILSYDYGRSNVALNTVITCKHVVPTNDDYTHQISDLARMIPLETTSSSSSVQIVQLLDALNHLHQFQESHPFVSLTKADLALSFYRRLRLLNQTLDKRGVQQIMDICDSALRMSIDLVQDNALWWNVLSAPFQYVCTLMAIDTKESLARVGSANDLFNQIVSALGTHLAIEAQTTVKLLLQDSLKKKELEVALLESAIQSNPYVAPDQPPDIDWNALLDPTNALHYMQRDFSTF
ncbi:LADA_0G02740g1_1 [Lachancea dasiensis]|uniref:LADA_0G02740g1_1 n=1 Tax=Lachancea dasiensis TaxID=1072105 RepID=A0A1G4JRF1_9SACH|nr:LADA_0G02740g1_1 [Lachancea dasiensis]